MAEPKSIPEQKRDLIEAVERARIATKTSGDRVVYEGKQALLATMEAVGTAAAPINLNNLADLPPGAVTKASLEEALAGNESPDELKRRMSAILDRGAVQVSLGQEQE